ncbi:MAG: hypothetical protein WDN44_10775 [Sphingomonas sp.]
MIGLLIAILTALELFRRLPVLASFRDLAHWGARSTALLRRRGVSEWAKERAMRLLSRRLFAKSVRAGALLALVAGADRGGAGARFDRRSGRARAWFDWRKRLWIVMVCLAYAFLRWQFRGLRRR